jgi:hypothetical protein
MFSKACESVRSLDSVLAGTLASMRFTSAMRSDVPG